MDLITSVCDTLPAWLGGIGGILSAIVAAYALARSIRADARHVVWQISNERDKNGRTSNWRLVNGSDGVKARLLNFDNVSDGLRDAIRGAAALPTEVSPTGFFPFTHDRSMASPYPTMIRVTWQEAPAHAKRFRRRKYTSVLYLD